MIPRMQLDEDLLRRLWLADVTTTKIARQLGCSQSTASKRAQQIGLPRRAVQTGTLPQALIVGLYVDDKRTTEEIGAQFGVSHTTIRRVLRARGVTLRRAVKRCPDLKAECVRLYRGGMTMKEIAPALGLTEAQVHHRLAKVLGVGSHGGARKNAGGWQRKRRWIA